MNKNYIEYYCELCKPYVKNSTPFSNVGNWTQHINGTSHTLVINKLKEKGVSNEIINKLVYTRMYCGDTGYFDTGEENETEVIKTI